MFRLFSWSLLSLSSLPSSSLSVLIIPGTITAFHRNNITTLTMGKMIFPAALLFQVALLLKVTKTNLVVTKLAAGGHKRDSQVRVQQF